MNSIDLRSDTVTWPTDSMRQAMARAEVGDDGYGDDPTVKRLEELGASLAGKEAALFVPSGTFGNQLAIFTHCPRGGEVVLDDSCHIVQHEAGASAVIAGVQLRCVETERGSLSSESILRRLRDPLDFHSPPTSLVCMENAHSNGRAIHLEEMKRVSRFCASRAIPVHLDGARIFNAAVALGTNAASIASCADSVMFCLSKGLCAPVGSLLAGSREFISAAHRKRKIMGGQLRQAGVLAACGLVALTEMLPRLGEDHETARSLAKALSDIPGVSIDTGSLDINIVYLRIGASPGGQSPDPQALCENLRRSGILANPPTDGLMRLVTHFWIKPDHIGAIAGAFRSALAL